MQTTNSPPASPAPFRLAGHGLNGLSWSLALMVLAIVLRLINLDAQGLWLDEWYSLFNATGRTMDSVLGPTALFTPNDVWSLNTLPNVWASVTVTDGGNSVLYFTFLHFWIAVFGVSDYVLRLPSVIFGVLTVIGIYHVTRSWLGARAAGVAGLIAATHPMLIRYSQEARGYAMGTFLVLLATHFFVQLLHDRSNDRPRLFLWYGLTAAAALLTHYLTAGVLVCHLVVALLWCRRAATWRRLLISAGIMLTLLGAWMHLGGSEGLTHIGNRNRTYQERVRLAGPDETYYLPASPKHLVAGVLQIAYLQSGNVLQKAGFQLRFLVWWLALPLGLILLALWSRSAPGETAILLVLMALQAASGLAVCTVLALTAGNILSFQDPYGQFAVPFLIILMGFGLARLAANRIWLGLAVALWLPVTAWSLLLVYDGAPRVRQRNHIAPLSRQIAALATSGDVVVYPNRRIAHMCNLYLPVRVPFHQREEPSDLPYIRLLRGAHEVATWPVFVKYDY